ncbi:glutamyl-tRNA reductase [Uliginosibacterium gangwonense]|uniref:glutamyl-tRNA reductase n=1 Tax=Uliginosibacterium gangwonense TaxID=392736 RepID=UPI00037F11D6|nr:glutamyl-tRNA reductase [Uliginosibacterium gangwonense]
MHIFALGLNHHTAPLAIRERLAFPAGSLQAALADLIQRGLVGEAALLSTCNRTELYCTTRDPQATADWLADYRQIPLREISPYLYTHPDRNAIRHMFRVACGLDSMVLGEAQILGQLKDSVRTAEQAGALGSVLHKLLQKSFSVAKEVRSSTAIGANIVSMAAAAVHLASRIFEQMSDTKVLFVGAGEMIHLCAHHFTGVSPAQMTIANRSLHRAQELAVEVGGKAVALETLGEILPQFDIVVSCTASPLPLIGHGMAERALKARRWRPMVMVDLAVPRDIEPEVAKLSDIFLYTVDDLSQIVSAGKDSRLAAVDEAEGIIQTQVDAFLHWLHTRDLVPTIRQLRDHAETLRLAELERARRLLAKGEDPQRVLEHLSQALTNKLLHGPTHYLNQAEDQDLAHAQEVVRQMFLSDSRNLSGRSQSNPAKPTRHS